MSGHILIIGKSENQTRKPYFVGFPTERAAKLLRKSVPVRLPNFFWPGSVLSSLPDLHWGNRHWKTVHWEIVWEWVHVTDLSAACHAMNSRATAFQHSTMSLPALLLMELGWMPACGNKEKVSWDFLSHGKGWCVLLLKVYIVSWFKCPPVTVPALVALC